MSGNNPEELVVYNLMQREEGRAWVWKHLQNSGVFDNMFDNNSIQHSFNAGRRSAGLDLERDFKEFAPDYYLKMLKENM